MMGSAASASRRKPWEQMITKYYTDTLHDMGVCFRLEELAELPPGSIDKKNMRKFGFTIPRTECNREMVYRICQTFKRALGEDKAASGVIDIARDIVEVVIIVFIPVYEKRFKGKKFDIVGTKPLQIKE